MWYLFYWGGLYVKSICNLCKVIHIYMQYFLRLGISKLTPNTNASSQSVSRNSFGCNILMLK